VQPAGLPRGKRQHRVQSENSIWLSPADGSVERFSVAGKPISSMSDVTVKPNFMCAARPWLLPERVI
jgi:hypothetical protein